MINYEIKKQYDRALGRIVWLCSHKKNHREDGHAFVFLDDLSSEYRMVYFQKGLHQINDSAGILVFNTDFLLDIL